jgi:adenylate cyclase
MTSLLQDDSGCDIGILIVFHDLSEIQKYTTLKSAFSRYVTEQVVEKITMSDEISLHGEKRNVTVLFSDIRDFTSLSEQLEPTEVVATLNAYFSAMIDVIYQYEGTLDKFLGDGIMCIFGAPIEQPDHAIRAAHTALAMQAALAQFNQQQQHRGKPTLHMGIGMNTGDAVVGNVGSEKRMEYTAIGDNVNLAARLQTFATGGQIIISQSTFAAIRSSVQARSLPFVTVKGKHEPIPIYELIDLRNDGH